MIAEGAGAALIIAAGIIDIRTKRIPNVLTLSMIVAGIGFHAFSSGWDGLLFAGWGMMCGLLPTLLLYAIRALGAGDVKLFAALGAWMGSVYTWQTFMLSIMVGGIIAGVLLVVQFRTLGTRFIHILQLLVGTKSIAALRPLLTQPATFPFMIAVLPATILVYMMGY